MKILSHILFVVLFLGVAPGVLAQERDVTVRLNKAELKGRALNLDADIRIDHLQVGRYESVSITLVLQGTGKGQTLRLQPVVVCGANKYQMYQRAIILHGEKEARNGAYAVLKSAPDLIQFQAYKRAVAYKSWMSNCQLILVCEVKNYQNNTIESSRRVLSRKLTIQGTPATTSRPTYNLPPANNRTTTRPTTTRPAATRPAATAAPSTNRGVNNANNNNSGRR
ncbi:MAG: DUF3868 domain-containing protein [Tannerellaceae bacterium]|jgi:hypothetical protein|nr:DUF3868 domain-containing protein [Tannerellaceae bacterium]